jgi:translation initiation factor IF-3
MKKNKNQHLTNREIRATEVRLTDKGVMTLAEALKIAETEGLDLVLLNDKTTPVICKIMNYEKFIYEQAKKPKSKNLEIKEIKLGPNTSENDLDYRIKHMIEFLQKGHKVKLSLQFRGREMAFIDKGKVNILKLIAAVEEFGIPESMPSMEGKKMFATIKPKTQK